jgi:starch-binding outer membrane protein, SusD/RagB family
MKNRKIFSLMMAGVLTLGVTGSCDESFLDQPPQGSYAYPSLTTQAGVEGMLINAYASLHGPAGTWYTTPINWVWGSVTSDEAYKGSEKIDQADVNPIQRFEVLPSNPLVRDKWNSIYNAIARANQVLQVLQDATGISDTDIARITAEARFLRGLSHLEAVKLYGNVPYVDELETEFKVPNDAPIWDKIEADFSFAYTTLPGTMSAVGRANKWAAAAYLAKTYMFESKFAQAKPLLEEIIAQGTTSAGVKYGLHAKYNDNFTIANENGKEAVFGMQFSVNDGSTTNGNYEMTLAYPAPIFTGCCGFYQPSQNLVNSYKTDANGLPLLDTFNDTDVANDEGLTSAQPFVEYTGTLDPRLDWTVGRRGIPYLDYGDHPGLNWIRDIGFSGPYSPKKNVFSVAERDEKLGGAAGWGWNNNAKNFILVRFADVILWHAECEAEIGSLAAATADVNMIRTRAANPAGFVREGNSPAGAPAANYLIGNYPTFASKDAALKAIRFERKLELAMEGHRYFDLVRWGIAEQVMDAYLAKEGTKRIEMLGGADFKPRNVHMPIPEDAINRSAVNGQPTLTQNDGY